MQDYYNCSVHNTCVICKFLVPIRFPYVSEHTVSAEGFLRDRSCPACSAVSATAIWRTSCSKTILERKGTAGGYEFQSSSIDVVTHVQQQRAVFLFYRACPFTVCVCFLSLCPVDVWWDWWMTSFWSPQIYTKQKPFSSKTHTTFFTHMIVHVTQDLWTDIYLWQSYIIIFTHALFKYRDNFKCLENPY